MKFCIRGYEVEFPHQPYGVQFSFMEKMLRTLDEQGNALLEAPTGCGKTLSLLCAALAWQTRRKKELIDLKVFKLFRSNLRGSAEGLSGADQKQKRQVAKSRKAPGSTSSPFSPSAGDYGDSPPHSASDDDFKPTAAAGGSRPNPLDKVFSPERKKTRISAEGDSSPSSFPDIDSGDAPSRDDPDLNGDTFDQIDDKGSARPPKIFFATRTHSQIAQVVRELKRSGYSPNMAILASKQHYCINNAVKRTGRVDEECERLLKEETHGCRFRSKATRGGHPPPKVGIHDIEELSKACAQSRTCPYFAARDMALDAELVFCPYAYLLDPVIRAALNIDVGGSVLIFDEAHNMEDVCREGGSMDLDLDVLREVEVSFRLAAQLTGRPELYSPLAEAVGRLGALLGRFEASAEGMRASGFEEHEAVWQGNRALALLDEAGLGPSAAGELYRVYDQAKAYEEKATFAMDGNAANEAIPASVTRPGAGGAALGTLGRLLTVLRLMYAPAPPPPHSPSLTQCRPQQQQQQGHHHHHHGQRQHPPSRNGGAVGTQPLSAAAAAAEFIPMTTTSISSGGAGGGGGGGGFIPATSNGPAGWRDGPHGGPLPPVPPPARDNSGDYRVVVKRWIAHGPKDRRKARSRHRHGDDEDVVAIVGPGAAVSLGLWCLNPGVAFRSLADKAHSVVLTSGTLAPLDSFASELGTEFHIRLEAPHVVDMSRQVWAAVVPRGPGGSLLSATYRESGTFAFQDDAGEAVLRYCEVIPDGVLLFMPSYGLLDKLMSRWKSTGLWSRLETAKTVVVEPREAGRVFEDAMTKYYAAVRGGKGGLFLAVCRGKASEGIDFADQHARGVILLGIPFPTVKDTKVKLKKEFNDAGCGPSSGRPLPQRLLSGDAWYNQQAFRALNQAVGRCIRHKYDWGAIILLDERFRSSQRQQQLSRWVRAAVKVHEDFKTSLVELDAFCKGLTADPPRPPLPQPQDLAEAASSTANAAAAGESFQARAPHAAASRKEPPSGSRQRIRKGGKGSVDLQYEECVVPPLAIEGKVPGGNGSRGRFDRFRLGDTSVATGQKITAANASGKAAGSVPITTRHTTSSFASVAAAETMTAHQASKPLADETGTSGKSDGGGGGGGGGTGREGDSASGWINYGTEGGLQYVDGPLRTHSRPEPPPMLLYTQAATQHYQPARPELSWDMRKQRPVSEPQPCNAAFHKQRGQPYHQPERSDEQRVQQQHEGRWQPHPQQNHNQPGKQHAVHQSQPKMPLLSPQPPLQQKQQWLGGLSAAVVDAPGGQLVSATGGPRCASSPTSGLPKLSPAAQSSFQTMLPDQMSPSHSTTPQNGADMHEQLSGQLGNWQQLHRHGQPPQQPGPWQQVQAPRQQPQHVGSELHQCCPPRPLMRQTQPLSCQDSQVHVHNAQALSRDSGQGQYLQHKDVCAPYWQKGPILMHPQQREQLKQQHQQHYEQCQGQQQQQQHDWGNKPPSWSGQPQVHMQSQAQMQSQWKGKVQVQSLVGKQNQTWQQQHYQGKRFEHPPQQQEPGPPRNWHDLQLQSISPPSQPPGPLQQQNHDHLQQQQQHMHQTCRSSILGSTVFMGERPGQPNTQVGWRSQQQLDDSNRLLHGQQQTQQPSFNRLQNQQQQQEPHAQHSCQQVAPGRPEVPGPSAVHISGPSGDSEGKSGAWNPIWGGNPTACREAGAACGTSPGDPWAAGRSRHGTSVGIAPRPVKRLTSSRAREAANKRQCMLQQNERSKECCHLEESSVESDDFVL